MPTFRERVLSSNDEFKNKWAVGDNAKMVKKGNLDNSDGHGCYSYISGDLLLVAAVSPH